MFHLSLPVRRFEACLAFYRDCFDAEVRRLSDTAADLFVFGGQVTLHDRPESGMSDAARRTMHFGQVVTPAKWLQLRDRVLALGYSPLFSVEAEEAANGRAKLLVVDPSGNLVEINSARSPG